jgi:hypothetical protein
MKRKGQAAMEFLMTYGWAILVVLAAIAALAYFGVLSPGNLLPDRTVFASPIPHTASASIDSTTDTIIIPLRNNAGFSINVTNVETESSDCTPTTTTLVYEGTDYDMSTETVRITNGRDFQIELVCPVDSLEQDDRVKMDVTLAYNDHVDVARRHTGTVEGKAT